MIQQIDDPLADPAQQEKSDVSRPAAPVSDPRRGMTVLLASARRSLIAWFQVVLTAAGLGLIVSPDGLHALMSAVREPPDLIILDDDLPGVDADRVEELLGRDARTAAARVMRVKSFMNAPASACDDDQDRPPHRLPAART